MTLNLKKSNVIHFRSLKKDIGPIPDVTFDGIKIEVVKSFKHLGVVLDEHLNWNYHVTELCNQISGQVGIIKRLNSFLPVGILKKLYFSLVHSRLSYCVGVRGGARKTLIGNLERLQRRALRVTFRLRKCCPTRRLFSMYCPNVITISKLYKYSVCRFVYSSLHDICHHAADRRINIRHLCRCFCKLLLFGQR